VNGGGRITEEHAHDFLVIMFLFYANVRLLIVTCHCTTDFEVSCEYRYV
jgi:hypothetical protein